MSDPIDIHVASDADGAEWSGFIAGHPHATLFQDWRWREAIRDGSGYAPIYLIARRAGRLCGVLPAFDVRSPLFGRSLVSTAFTVGGGICADDVPVGEALGAALLREGHARGVAHVELRGGSSPVGGRAQRDDGEWREKTGVHAGFVRDLLASTDDMLAAIPRKRRAELRKGFKLMDEKRLTVQQGRDIDTFYRLYAHSLRALGTPVFSRGHIEAIARAFGDDLDFMVVSYDGEPVTALCSFYWGDTVFPYYIGMTDAAREARAGDIAYWSLMVDAIGRGYKRFDFGRSKLGSPHELYKKTWGFEGQPLTYQIGLVRAQSVPDLNPNNPKFALATAAWKRLPLWAANRIGPIVARNFA